LNDNEIKSRILQSARERFFKYGYSKTTTDEIASDTAISKKTMYKFFASKEEILSEMVDAMLAETSAFLDDVVKDDSMDFTDKMKVILNYVGNLLSKIQTHFMMDLHRKAPHIWTRIDEFRNRKFPTVFGHIFEKGREEGLFRQDIDLQMFILLYTGVIRSIINPEVLSQNKFSATQAFENIITIFLRGILSEEARTKYREIL
jgi:AcrR family transcriptional regulator